ncbi:tubulin-like doman-containing protein [Paraburkholderia azotifigens]|uniref:tubulin-like doman-containing protein n=1 Tax=Paraburkholderia azotifigens TaxID=2057004 RepID=UPI003181DD68
MRGRPTPSIGTTEAKLQQRKLDALTRGVHRIKDVDSLPYGIHMIGVGGAGAHVIEQVLRDVPDDLLQVEGSRFSALAVDIGDHDLEGIRALAARLPASRAQVESIALDVPTSQDLLASLQRYRDFLKLEYPLYHWNPDYEPWLPPETAVPKAGEPMPRAVAKAIYGKAYYDGVRPMFSALRRFARSVEATEGDAVVCIVFGLGGGTGSGIALDLARHLSNGLFGRRVLVTGIGIAPCDRDTPQHVGAHLFPVMNELDCLGDQDKNRGITMPCGDLFKNPFTAGFLMVPQQHVCAAATTLEETHRRVNQEIASLLTLRHGANLWEVLRLLNWVAAPATQHSAARTPWGPRWIHMLGFADTTCSAGDPVTVAAGLPRQMGLRPGYSPEFIEMRVASAAAAQNTGLVESVQTAFAPVVPPSAVDGGREGSVQFVLPRVSKTDVDFFHTARDAYDAQPPAEKLLNHALLLDQGVVLCEPSTRLEGMGGASYSGSKRWVAVPMADLRGELNTPSLHIVDQENSHAA